MSSSNDPEHSGHIDRFAPDRRRNPKSGEPDLFDDRPLRSEPLELLINHPYSLTDEQSLAVLQPHDDQNPVLVRAGPGSGKTTVIVRRFIFYLLTGYSVEDILCITFTRRAAREMKTRIKHQIQSFLENDPPEKSGLENAMEKFREGEDWVTTFHSAATRLLTTSLAGNDEALIQRVEGNYESDFKFLGAEEIHRQIKDIIERNGYGRGFSPREILQRINRWRVNLIPPDEALRMAESDFDFSSARVYKAMERFKRSGGMMDYMDLIYYTGKLMRANREVRDKLGGMFRCVLIDEFQDTNPAQQMMISNIVKQGGRLYAVGDEKQAIFGWRGASLEMMRNFQQSFPGAKELTLSVNFRSKTFIILTSNVVAEQCLDGESSTMDPPTNEGGLDYGERPGLFVADSETEEEDFLVHYIEKITDSTDYSYSDVAVLVRLNKQKKELRKRFKKESIPTTELGSGQFFNRATTRAFLACLRCLKDIYREMFMPDDRTQNSLPEYWSDWATSDLGPLDSSGTTVLESVDYPSFLTASRGEGLGLEDEPSHRFSRSLNQAMKLLRNIALELNRGDFLPHHLDELKRRCFKVDNRLVGKHLRECVAWAKQNIRQDGFRGLVDFLNRSKLQEFDPQFSVDSQAEGIILSTIHGAKGMEFPIVLMPGIEEGWLPRSDGSNGVKLDEERRLFYVGMTRAMEDLVLSYSLRRTINDRPRERKPSRFLEDIPDEFLEVRNPRQGLSKWIYNLLKGMFTGR